MGGEICVFSAKLSQMTLFAKLLRAAATLNNSVIQTV